MSETTQQTQPDETPDTAVRTVTVGTETDHPVDVGIPSTV